MWVANRNLYEAEDVESFVYEQFGSLADDMNTEDCKVKYNYIPVCDVQCFLKEGDIQYTTKILGGGGGGSSLTGAIIGGILAGGVGAIIGSRKEVEDIKSESVAHDNRSTIIRYYKNDELFNIEYPGFEVYQYLLKKIPDKDLVSMMINQKSSL